MSVAGGDLKLPDKEKYFVNLELDYSNVSKEEAIELASGGSSVRVKSQSMLREMESVLKEKGVVAEDLGTAEKNGLDKKGFIRFDVSTDFASEGKTRNPQRQAASAYSKMTREQKVAFVAENMGLSEEEAEKLVPADEE